MFEDSYPQTKEDLSEDLYFCDWKDESCANYVGYLKKFKNFNIIVSREWAGKAGLYELTKVLPTINSGSDPFGAHPGWWKDKINNLSLDQVRVIIEKYEEDER